VFIEAKDDGGGGDNWSYRSCKAPVKSSPSTNQNPVFTGRMPFLSPNQQCQSTEGKNITFHGLAYPKLTWKYLNTVVEVSVTTLLTCEVRWGEVRWGDDGCTMLADTQKQDENKRRPHVGSSSTDAPRRR